MTREQIEELVSKQYELNNNIAGKMWVFDITKDNRKINWEQAIVMESVEMFDSFNWKWWKSIESEHDLNNARLELSDIFHFVISSIISTTYINYFLFMREGDYVLTEKSNMLFDDKLTAESFTEGELLEIESMFNIDIKSKVVDFLYSSLSDVELVTSDSQELIKILIQKNSSQVLFNEEFPAKNEAYTYEQYVERLMAICSTNGIIINWLSELLEVDLYNLYSGKNILNQFRQDNGYKEGTYTKIWDGVEDNVVMMDSIRNGDIENLYSHLEKIYNKF